MTNAARIVRIAVVIAVASLALVRGAAAQAGDSSWNAEAAVGWDIGLSGDFLSAGIGTLQGVPIVIEPQSFGDVYGNGVQWEFSAGYMVDEINEVRAQFSYQRVGSDVVTVGTAGASDLVATFDDYKSFNVEAGYRHYFARRRERLRPYVGASFGVAIITEIDAVFASSAAGLTRYATDFYDGTAALALGVNGGTLYALTDRIDLNLRAGFRFNSGLSQIDALEGTDLEDINDKSARWTMPILVGVRINF
jgi:hypothetical protein